MSDVKHLVTFADGSVLWLFGPDYWMDKKVFHNHHWSVLEGLKEKVERTGYPVQIEDQQLKTQLIVHSIEELRAWFEEQQPSGFKL